MLKEIYLSIILALAAGITIYGIMSVPFAIFETNLKGLVLDLCIFIAGLSFLKRLTS